MQSISVFKNHYPPYDILVGLGTDGAIILGAQNSVMSRLRCKQPALVALHIALFPEEPKEAATI